MRLVKAIRNCDIGTTDTMRNNGRLTTMSFVKEKSIFLRASIKILKINFYELFVEQSARDCLMDKEA